MSEPPSRANLRRERFEALFDEWHLPVLAYLARRTVPPSDAADVLAEVFLVAWRRIDDVPDDAAAGPWLFGVARRCLANHRRSGMRRAALGARLAIQLDEVVAPPDHTSDLADVRAALRTLPPADRELLTLIAWEGLSPAAAAKALGVSTGTVRVRLHRARRRLRDALSTESAPIHATSVALSAIATAQEEAR